MVIAAPAPAYRRLILEYKPSRTVVVVEPLCLPETQRATYERSAIRERPLVCTKSFPGLISTHPLFGSGLAGLGSCAVDRADYRLQNHRHRHIGQPHDPHRDRSHHHRPRRAFAVRSHHDLIARVLACERCYDMGRPPNLDMR